MKIVAICTIRVNGNSNPNERQLISWNPNDGKLYTSNGGWIPVDDYTYEDAAEAARACYDLWEGDPFWGIEFLDDTGVEA